MAEQEPVTEVDARYGDEGAGPTPWADAASALEHAELYWCSTTHPEGTPHVAPLIGVWRDGEMHFCTGAHERKARNLAVNPRCSLTTGTNTWADGLDVVVSGSVERITEPAALQELADAWEAKYGSDWHFDVADGGFEGGGGVALVYRVAPTTVHAFAKSPHSQTRYTFARS